MSLQPNLFFPGSSPTARARPPYGMASPLGPLSTMTKSSSLTARGTASPGLAVAGVACRGVCRGAVGLTGVVPSSLLSSGSSKPRRENGTRIPTTSGLSGLATGRALPAPALVARPRLVRALLPRRGSSPGRAAPVLASGVGARCVLSARCCLVWGSSPGTPAPHLASGGSGVHCHSPASITWPGLTHVHVVDNTRLQLTRRA
jgi:hypothetical protein